MKIKRLIVILACMSVFSPVQAEDGCTSDIAAIQTMQRNWDTPSAPRQGGFVDDIVPTSLQLRPRTLAEMESGPLNIKSHKTMQFFNRYQWSIAVEGDYWIAADSGVWIDVSDGNGVLVPVTFNHGLRCAGIHKALKFHLRKGLHQLLVASDAADKVKIAAVLEPDTQ
jgi:hypothetical protein